MSPMPTIATLMRKNRIANSVNSPSASEPEEKPPEKKYRDERERPQARYEPSDGEHLQRHERKARYEVEVQAD